MNVPATPENAKWGIPDIIIDGKTVLKDIQIQVAWTRLAERRDQVNRLYGLVARPVYTLTATHEGGDALGPVLSVNTGSAAPGGAQVIRFLLDNSAKSHTSSALESCTVSGTAEYQSEQEFKFDEFGNATLVAPESTTPAA